MKRIFCTVIVLIMVISTGAFALDKIAKVIKTPAPAAQDDFQSSPNWNKLEDRLQQLWIAYKNGGDGDYKVEGFVVSSEMVDSGDRSFLLDHGFATQIATERVARGHFKVKDLPIIADLYFVKQIKMAEK